MNIINILPAFYDFDVFARKTCLFYNKNEKIGSDFSLILTLLYILSALAVFIFYLIIICQKKDFKVNDSFISSQTIPSANLNTSNLFFLIIGITNKNNLKFIDESIYRVNAIYVNQYKDSKGHFVNKEIKQLQVGKCQKEKYNQKILKEIEFDNSYCIDHLDIDLIGGKFYNNYSFIEIQILQCINSSDNNNFCKPQEMIDDTLEDGHFSIQLKNIELNPNNYSYPILPTVQEFNSSISKYFYKNIIFLYKITKVESYSGFLNERKKIVEDLKLDDTKENIYYISNNKKIISKINIRLNNGIHIQKRIYKNIFNVLAITGGYMNIIYCFFYLMSFIYNKFKFEKIIVNSLMNMDLKYEKKLPQRVNIIKRNSSIFPRPSKKNVENKSGVDSKKNDASQNDKKNIPIKPFQRRSVCIENIFHFNSRKSNNLALINDNAQFSFMDQSNNASRVEILPNQSELKIISKRYNNDQSNFGDQSLNVSVNKSINKSLNKSVNKSINKSINRSLNKSLHKHIKFDRKYSIFVDNTKKKKIKNVNFFDFYFGKFLNKKKELDLLTKCSSIYKERMDLINLFKVQIIFENFLKNNVHLEKNGLNEEIKIFSNKKNSILA